MMDKISELEQRIDEYRKHSIVAEKVALRKLQSLPRNEEKMGPNEVLRRELFRHHTRTLLLDELKLWIEELKGVRLYQLYLLGEREQEDTQIYQIRQQMTEKEAAEVNSTYESNNERLRWKPVDMTEEEEQEEESEFM